VVKRFNFLKLLTLRHVLFHFKLKLLGAVKVTLVLKILVRVCNQELRELHRLSLVRNVHVCVHRGRVELEILVELSDSLALSNDVELKRGCICLFENRVAVLIEQRDFVCPHHSEFHLCFVVGALALIHHVRVVFQQVASMHSFPGSNRRHTVRDLVGQVCFEHTSDLSKARGVNPVTIASK
jgi:hypothetical protein